MKKIKLLFLLISGLVLIAYFGSCGDDDEGGCPGSIISSCVDPCPEDCAAQGKIEVCVGAGYEPNRCCYCE